MKLPVLIKLRLEHPGNKFYIFTAITVLSGGNLTFSFNPWDQITSPYYCNIDCV